jgi:LysM repeat protein
MKLHIMKEGETLLSLSERYGVSLEQIIDYNHGLPHLETLPMGTKVKIPASTGKLQDMPAYESTEQLKTIPAETTYLKTSRAEVSGQATFTYPLPKMSWHPGGFANLPHYTFYPAQMSATPFDFVDSRSQTTRQPLPYAMPLVTQAMANLSQMSGIDRESNPMEVIDSPVVVDNISSEPPQAQEEQEGFVEISDIVSKRHKIARKNRRVSRAEQVRKLLKRSHKHPPLARHGHSIPWIRD